MTDDGEDAGKRQADATGLAQRKTFAEQREAPQRHVQRRRRLQQQPVDRGRILQRVVSHHVVDGEAGEGEQRHDAGMLADRRPIAHQMRRRERQHDQEGAAPADAGQRNRRHMPDDITGDDGIAGPEQRGQRQQQIGLVEQPAALLAGKRDVHLGHEKLAPRRRKSAANFFVPAELARTGRDDHCARRMTGPEFTNLRQSAGVAAVYAAAAHYREIPVIPTP